VTIIFFENRTAPLREAESDAHRVALYQEKSNGYLQDVNLEQRYVVLYTRKKRGGHRTPRKVPMADKLYELLSHRVKNRDKRNPWVFWHRYWSRKKQESVVGPYLDRNRIMEVLCEKAGVRYFRFHALRHFGASMLEQSGVPVGSIQRLLGH
jgi:integrase